MEFEKHNRFSKNDVAPKIELAYQVMNLKQKKPHCKKRSKNLQIRLQNQSTSNQPIWRRTIVLTKAKHKAKLPRIFRADRITGLPLDYERTVSKIMHYVNPQASSSPSPDQLMEELLTQTLAGYLVNANCSNRASFEHHMRMILQNQGTYGTRKDPRNDEVLDEFHCACKRKPLPPINLVPTYESKFNYNNLKIKSN